MAPRQSPRPISRRALLRGGAAGALGLGLAESFGLEPRWLQITRHDVPIAGLPRSLHGYTIAQISDLHLDDLGSLHEAIEGALGTIDPQLVVLTGDIVDSDGALGLLEEFCRRLRAPGRTLLATMGNWEHWGRVPVNRLEEAYRRQGASLLGNESRALSSGLVVAATNDFCSGFHDTASAFNHLPKGGARVLLTHAPGLFDALPKESPRFDLALAGHTHGGQVRPLGLTVAVPPGSGRYVAGMYETPTGRAYVSRGLGTSVVPLRHLCRPELPVFRLVSAA